MSTARTHFELLELPQRYALDLAELEARYRQRSRHWHPDRFSRAPAAERAQVLARATDLNEAYRTLRSSARRAQYLLKLHGIDVTREGPGSSAGPGSPATVDPAFLMEILELREELVEARLGHDAARLAMLKADVQRRMDALEQTLSDGFARLEAGLPDGAERAAVLAELTQAVLAQRYYQRFCDELAEYEEARAEQAQSPPP